MPRKPTGAQIIGEILRQAGQGVGQYHDLKQYEEQKKLQEEDREWIKMVRGWRKEDRQRDIAQAKREQQVKQRAQSFLKILGGDSPFAPEIPDVNIQRQKAYDILGRTAPPTIGAGALKEHLIQAGEPEPTAELARLKKLGIAPKAPSEPSATQEDRARWVRLKLNPKRTPAEELEYQSLNKTYGTEPPDTSKETEKRQKELEKDQKQWDKDVRQWITPASRNAIYPRMNEILQKYGVFLIGRNQIPKDWQPEKKDSKWFEYLMELNSIRNMFGTRPQTTIMSTPDEVPADIKVFFE